MNKEQHKERVRQLRLQKNELINNSKLPCAKCGESRKYVLDFHHKDPTKKIFGLCKEQEHGIKKIEEEIKKCVCLCRNCHTEFHYIYGQKATEEDLEEYLKAH